ncbi:MAG: gamma-glutamyltransferase family protein [Alphaproteobacteria bacterium]|jgi:gamma-glutamyltranspeptidase/glutathione hydrolase|nr:gamma-glutamyltransferase family protein [Alphaproteobacteria bacterium]
MATKFEDEGRVRAAGPMRPALQGTRHMVSAGHYLAAHAGFEILEAGGNAVDAGVAGGLVLGVVQSELVNIAGVAPIMIYLAEAREVVTISGLGVWPKALQPDLFQREHDGAIPESILRTVVPAAPDAWITALARYGTMRFGEVARAAIRFAADGFVMHPLMAKLISENADGYRRWPANAAIYLPGGQPPAVGDRFVQADLARTLQYMADEERAAANGDREAALAVARDAFYKGDIAREIVRYHEANGGLMRAEDLAEYRSAVEPPVSTRFRGTDVYACGPWCQGPALPQALNILDGIDLEGLGHNSPAYIHALTETMKLVFADRHAHIGDPRFVEVPLDGLLSEAYAAERRALIRDNEAWPDMPPAGDPSRGAAIAAATAPVEARDEPATALDTSYIAVVDSDGNAFSATPSDTSHNGPVVPGTGLCPSTRGSQSWTDPAHPSSAAPGKRPRLTPNPAIAVRDGEYVMPFGTPGGDVQIQAMVQTFLNLEVFAMEAQTAVEAPRFATASFPNSFEPHNHYPGRLMLEGSIAEETGDALAALGHEVQWWPAGDYKAGAMCLVKSDMASGIYQGAADFRRACYAVGW